MEYGKVTQLDSGGWHSEGNKMLNTRRRLMRGRTIGHCSGRKSDRQSRPMMTSLVGRKGWNCIKSLAQRECQSSHLLSHLQAATVRLKPNEGNGSKHWLTGLVIE